jgi:RNase P/RNase MRP subunit POP5
VKYFSPHTNIGILRISREEVHIVWGALTFIKELKGKPCIIKVLHTAGTFNNVFTMIHYVAPGATTPLFPAAAY